MGLANKGQFDRVNGCLIFRSAEDDEVLHTCEAVVYKSDRRPGAVRYLLRKVQPSAGFIFGAGASPLIGTRAPDRTVPGWLVREK